LTIDGRKTAKVDGGYDGGKYIKKVNNFAITCKYWWRGKDLNLRPSGYGPDFSNNNSYLTVKTGRYWLTKVFSGRYQAPCLTVFFTELFSDF